VIADWAATTHSSPPHWSIAETPEMASHTAVEIVLYLVPRTERARMRVQGLGRQDAPLGPAAFNELLATDSPRQERTDSRGSAPPWPTACPGCSQTQAAAPPCYPLLLTSQSCRQRHDRLLACRLVGMVRPEVLTVVLAGVSVKSGKFHGPFSIIAKLPGDESSVSPASVRNATPSSYPPPPGASRVWYSVNAAVQACH